MGAKRTGYLSVKNFEKFQHYRDRRPLWIKLYGELLDDYDFQQLPDATKWHLVGLWLVASRTLNVLPSDPRWLRERLSSDTRVNVSLLVRKGFLIRHASNPLAMCLPRDRDRDRDRDREEKTLVRLASDVSDPTEWWNGPAFDEFWDGQPRKVAKVAARRAWSKLCPPNRKQGEALLDRIGAIWRERATEWAGRESKHIPHPATFLRSEEF